MWVASTHSRAGLIKLEKQGWVFYGSCMVRKALDLMEIGPPWGHTRWVTRWVRMRHVRSGKNTCDIPSASAAEAAAMQQPGQGRSTVGHAKPYSSYNSWSNLLIFGHNTLHRHTHRLTLAFLICALMSKWQAWPTVDVLEIGKILRIFPSGTGSMGDRGSKKAYMGPTKFGCDRSIMVGCRSWNDRHPDRQTEWNDNKARSLRTWCNRLPLSQ